MGSIFAASKLIWRKTSAIFCLISKQSCITSKHLSIYPSLFRPFKNVKMCYLFLPAEIKIYQAQLLFVRAHFISSLYTSHLSSICNICTLL